MGSEADAAAATWLQLGSSRAAGKSGVGDQGGEGVGRWRGVDKVSGREGSEVWGERGWMRTISYLVRQFRGDRRSEGERQREGYALIR